MTLDVFRSCLTAFVQRRPFRPFLIELMSGDRVRVTHPEAVGIQKEMIYHASPQKVYQLFDGSSVCQLRDEPVDDAV